MKKFNCLSLVISGAMLAAGAAYAEPPTKIEGVPSKPAVKAGAPTMKSRSEVRAEARSATRMVPRTGGEVAADAGKPTQADTLAMFSTSDKTRDEVRADARYDNKSVRRARPAGGEGADTGRNLYW